MGDKQNRPFQLSFNGLLKIDFQGSRITSDGGLVLVRELDERLGLSELIGEHLTDHRGPNSRLPLADLFRQSVYSRLAGHEHVNDAEQLWQGPTFRLIGTEKIWERGAKYAIRIPANDSLERDIAGLLTRPVGRPSHKPVVRYKSFLYQAASWNKARRVVAKVEFHAGELFPRVGFIVANLETDSRAVVRFYNRRGTAEQWIKEGKQAVKMTRLSCHRFRSNEVRLWLSVIAYNLGNLWRRLVLPRRIEKWSLTSLQQRLVKTGARMIKHARYYWLLLAESHLTKRLFGVMVRRIAALPLPAG